MKIELEGMYFRAYHGCLESERLNGNDFIVDFSAEYDFSAASQSDNLEDTLNYAAIYDLVKREMAVPSDLLEHVAGRIVRAIEEEFPGLEHFTVSVSKKNPPVDGPCDLSRVIISK